MTTRLIQPFELPVCLEGGRQFFAEGKLPGGFDEAYFLQRWTWLIEHRIGFVLVLFGDDGVGKGALAWKVGAGDFSPKRFATEAWWFMLHGQRGGGLLLLNAFEQWCRENDVDFGMMVHLVNLQPEKLGSLYLRRGYAELERVYVKGFK